MILNDYDGMRIHMEKFIQEVQRVDKEVKELQEEITQVDNETKGVKKKLLDLRFIKSIEESRIKSKKKYS